MTTTDPLGGAATPSATTRTTPLRVEIWSDVACPWCYIGRRRFAAALADFPHRDRVHVRWRSYQLSPEAPVGSPLSEAQMLADMKGLPLDAVHDMFAHVTEVAASVGLTYRFDTVRPANTFDAHRLIHLARRRDPDLADAVVEALMSAHFEQGLAVDDREVLVAIGAGAGLDPGDVRSALAGDAAADDVLADLEEGRAVRVSGVPFFVLDRRFGVSGAQPTELFAQALQRAWDAGR
ncbi:DsbA family oxidoreductase [Cellulomonas aerilata]|uniref:DSBA oxidoreductase n=1 Tax=Cellulomonas aerilata TaxID=515326 RepID=A0A512DGB1_9CELL|nr:DsbA family oxidoreductase [Cellulomonas aerilata]GEO35511.1 DSBA oxidoreductase [Cellulomonas aerilata]